jgi:hypothetical protein
MLLSLPPLEAAAAGQAPASTNGAVFVAYYWRAKPGQLEAYNQSLDPCAELRRGQAKAPCAKG